jgi:polygalacturonase
MPVTADIKTAFGAKGDGVSDDTAAFEVAIAAIARKGTLLLPKGTYVITRVRTEAAAA